MSRRITLPGADELFRNTESPIFGVGSGASGAASSAATSNQDPSVEFTSDEGASGAPGGTPSLSVVSPDRIGGATVRSVRPARPRRKSADRRPSGREAHDEKITVYVSAEELIDLEHAKITLRSDQGLAVDRGRIVREAVAIVLADLEARGEDSVLVRRLRGL
jgi:hypothetical protein